MKNVLEYIIWRNYWGTISVLSLLETVTKKRKWAGSRYCSEGRALGLCMTAGYLKFLVSLETPFVIPIGACVSMMSYNLQIHTMDLLLGNYRVVQTGLEKYLNIHKNWEGCMRTGVCMLARYFSQALILMSNDSLVIHFLIFSVRIQLFKNKKYYQVSHCFTFLWIYLRSIYTFLY